MAIQAPDKSRSVYYNYKNLFSIVLMAVEDADLIMLLIEMGANDRPSGAGIYAASSLAHAFVMNTLNIPPAEPLPGRQSHRRKCRTL